MTAALNYSHRELVHPSLPAPYQRRHVVEVLDAIAPKIGLGSAALRVLQIMIRMTTPAAWTNGADEPMCYREQMKVAAVASISTRALRNHEAELERLGLIEKRVGANGSRGRFARGSFVNGISFAPLVVRFVELQNLMQEAEAEVREIEILRRQCSTARRELNRLLADMAEVGHSGSAVVAAVTLKADLPRRYDGLSRTDLEQLFSRVDATVLQLKAERELSQELTATPEGFDRPHIQPTTDSIDVSCSGSSANERPARKRADNNTLAAVPGGTAESHENYAVEPVVSHKPKLTETFTPSQLYSLAGSNMRMYLDARPQPGRPLTDYDFILAAEQLCGGLGIHLSAWDEAVSTMGDLAASLALLVIDANLMHPVRPIHSPGGALRAFTRRAAAGQLNLHGSLIGLKQRWASRGVEANGEI